MEKQWIAPQIVELNAEELARLSDLKIAYASSNPDRGTSDYS